MLTRPASAYRTPIALRKYAGVDPDRDEDMRLVEECAWDIVGERLCVIFNASTPEAVEEARAKYVDELQVTIQSEVEEALQMIDTVNRKGSDFQLAEHRRMLHSYRRRVAGYHQAMELLSEGKATYMAAMRAKLLIFEGHRYVQSQFSCLHHTLIVALSTV